MTIRHTIILVLVACFAGVSYEVSGAIYNTTMTGEYAWDDPDGWANGVVPPDDISPLDYINIRNEVVLMTSLGNRGTINVSGVLTIFGGNNAKSLVNEGQVVVASTGIVRILRNRNATSSPNTIVNLMGSVTLNGTLEILGGDLVNLSNIDLMFGSTLYNYGHQNGSNQVITSDGTVIDLDTFLGSLGSGRLAEPEVTDENWTCLSGFIDNTMGTMNFEGGSFEDADCGGGLYTGPMLESTNCVVETVYATGTAKDGITLNWAPVINADKYLIGVRNAAGDFDFIAKIDETKITLPSKAVGASWNVEYSVAAVCDDRAAYAINKAEAAAVLERTGNESSFAVEPITMFPNPASEILYLQPQMDVKGSTINIFDPSGRLMESLMVNQNELMQISLDKYSAGTYIVRLNNGEHHTNQLIMVSE